MRNKEIDYLNNTSNDKPIIAENNDTKVIGMFLATKQRRSEKTAMVYAGVINEFFRFLNYKPLQQISYEDLVHYSEYLASPDAYRNPVVLAVSTQNRKISTIKSLFKYAMKIGYIRFNPAEPLETQRVDSKIAQRILSSDELEIMFETAQKKGTLYSLILCFFACTGCRVSELCGLMWRDFYIDSSGIICVRIQGKGHKDRNLKINDSLWEIMVLYRKEKGLNYEIDPRDRSPFLINKFANPYHPQSIWKIIKTIGIEAGIKKDVSPHWIRHTFATEVSKDQNSNIWRLQYDMGHASLTTTQAYVHIARGMRDTSVDHLQYLNKFEK